MADPTNVNYGFFLSSTGTPIVLPDANIAGGSGISKVDYNTWKQIAQSTGVRAQNLSDPQNNGLSIYDSLLNGTDAKVSSAIRAAESGGAPISFGQLQDGTLIGNEAIAQNQKNEADYNAGLLTKTIINGVPVYQPKGAAPFQQGSQGQTTQVTTTPANGGAPVTTTAPSSVGAQVPQGGNTNPPTGGTVVPPTGGGNATQQAQATQGAQTYTVKPGDTVSGIAARFGVPVSQVTGYKSGNPNKIYPGETLQIGSTQPTYSSGGSTTGGTTGTPQKSNIQKRVDQYVEVSNALGLPSIKAQYEQTLKDQQALIDQKNKDIADVNNDPWSAQSVRDRKLAQIEKKYENRLTTYSNLAKLYESLYEKGQTQAKEILNDVQADEKYAAELAQKQQDAANAILKDNQIVSIAGNYWLVNKVSGQKLVNLGPQTHFTSGTKSVEDQINALFQ